MRILYALFSIYFLKDYFWKITFRKFHFRKKKRVVELSKVRLSFTRRVVARHSCLTRVFPRRACANGDICIMRATRKRGCKRVKHFLIRRHEKGENTCRGTCCAITRCRKDFAAILVRDRRLNETDRKLAGRATAALPRVSREITRLLFPH